MSVLHLSLDEAGLEAAVTRGRQTVWRARTEGATPADLGATLQTLAAQAPARLPRQAVVELGPPWLQLRILTGLPRLPRRRLRQLAASGATRFFRQNGSPLLTDAAGQPGADWQVRAAAVEHSVAETIAAQLAEAGLRLVDLRAPAAAGPVLSLLPVSEREARQRRLRRTTRWLALAAAGAWLGCTLVVASALWIRERRLDGQVSELREAGLAVGKARRQGAEARAMLDSVADTEVHRGDLSHRLGRLVDSLPANGVVRQLTLDRHGNGTVEGWRSGLPSLADEYRLRLSPGHADAPE